MIASPDRTSARRLAFIEWAGTVVVVIGCSLFLAHKIESLEAKLEAQNVAITEKLDAASRAINSRTDALFLMCSETNARVDGIYERLSRLQQQLDATPLPPRAPATPPPTPQSPDRIGFSEP